MAYDIHIDKESSDYQFGFPENVHEEIFKSNFVKDGEFQFFKRMSDYYKDSKFRAGEIEGLVSDLNKLIAHFSDTPALADPLCELKHCCKKAIHQEATLAGYCD